ncbi:hypothetical protein CRG98_033934 [Punica granatum]|uniref:CCHC-type domain-containing protein n=1 Tax=Punica granatum TaxID=22663 RepID=A0A2I0INP3_PUNGR|nr:hypothetical protein CRG98_033934 [Punica granatum]
MMLERWDRSLPLEEINFSSVPFWIQLRGIPPELLSKQNITQLAQQAGTVIEIDWKNKGSTPKWFVTPQALVRVPTTKPLCHGYLIARRNNSASWVHFKYENLATFCYDCGALGHEQRNCSSNLAITPDKFGPWLRFDLKNDIPPPQVAAVLETASISPSTTYCPPPLNPIGSSRTPHCSPKPSTLSGGSAPKKPFKLFFNIPDNLAAFAPDFDVPPELSPTPKAEEGAVADGDICRRKGEEIDLGPIWGTSWGLKPTICWA